MCICTADLSGAVPSAEVSPHQAAGDRRWRHRGRCRRPIAAGMAGVLPVRHHRRRYYLPREAVATRHTRFHRADQGSADDLAALCAKEGPFDVIIDDGSHLSFHQLFTFHHLFDALKDGGIYVIEDVHTSFWPNSVDVGGVDWDGADIDDADFRRTCVGYFLELAKHLNHADFSGRGNRISPRRSIGSVSSTIWSLSTKATMTIHQSSPVEPLYVASFTAATIFSAASVRLSAAMIGRFDFASISLPSCTLVPSSRTTAGPIASPRAPPQPRPRRSRHSA